MSDRIRRVMGVTGSRAEFGLLRPVFAAIQDHADLELIVVAGGSHLLPPSHTIGEVRRAFDVAQVVELQTPAETGRLADAAALGRGTVGFATAINRLKPDVCLVLGDRIEAFAAASAAAVAGVRIAHLHGGDRAEGIADEGIRHAITKLAHVHLPATAASAERIARMGEDAARIHVVGSPAVDGLASFPPLDEARFAALGAPEIVFLMHGCADHPNRERERATGVLAGCSCRAATLALEPNHDAGRESILDAIRAAGVPTASHLPRDEFVGLLRRVRVLAGNSSAGLIEAAALGVQTLNIGARQAGRERTANVIDVPDSDEVAIGAGLDEALARAGNAVAHPYGDGHAGERVATILAALDLAACSVRKCNTY